MDIYTYTYIHFKQVYFLFSIEELTESEDKSIPSQQTKSIKGDEEEAESSNAKSESESDIEHLRPDFLDKLFDFIEKFKIKTDININKTKDKFVSKLPIKENIVKGIFINKLIISTTLF